MQSSWIIQNWQPLLHLLLIPSAANLVSVHFGFEATYPSQLYLSNETYERNFYYIQGLLYPKQWLDWFSVPILQWDPIPKQMAFHSLLALHLESEKGEGFFKPTRMLLRHPPCLESPRAKCLFAEVTRSAFTNMCLWFPQTKRVLFPSQKLVMRD